MFKPGDQVTCIHPVESYDSNYGPNKGIIIEFKPGMIGTVSSIAPKVTKVPKLGDPRYDNKADFLVVDYLDENQQARRTALHFCNAQRAKPITKTPA